MPGRYGANRPRRRGTAPLMLKKKGRRTNISKSIDWKKTKGEQVHYHIRWKTLDTSIPLNLAGAGIKNTNFQFALSDLQNYTELSALYDQYKITKCIMYLNWSPFDDANNYVNDNYSTPELLAPILNYLVDYDDTSVMTEAELKQRSRVKQIRMKPGVQYKIALTPACLTEIYRTGVSSSYAPKFNQILDMGSPDVPHYGLKTLVKYHPAKDIGSINVRFKYYVSCYNTR